MSGKKLATDNTGEILEWLTGTAGDDWDAILSSQGGGQGTGDSQGSGMPDAMDIIGL